MWEFHTDVKYCFISFPQLSKFVCNLKKLSYLKARIVSNKSVFPLQNAGDLIRLTLSGKPYRPGDRILH